MNTKYLLTPWLLAAALVAFTGCTPEDETGPADTDSAPVDDPTLVSADELFEGAPSNDDLPGLAKADQNFPERFTDLTAVQSPVKSQGSRGVCSIFATAAYMEHLYISEGTITDLDVSEQYLQWSAKFEVGSFPNSGGSNARYNLQAISDYGVPEESAWPYESAGWGTSDNPECDGEDDQPTECHTNGQAPESAQNAEKYFLPSSKYVSTRERDIKAHIFNDKHGVQVGLTFFYQSWNHRRSQLPRNLDYWSKGYVLYPNAKDKEISLEKRAGHSILLLGWDDNLAAPIMDEEGNQLFDENGEPIVEEGFFLFKNSWGKGSFGAENPEGDGYGWISYRYVQEYGSGRVAGEPELDTVAEICGDGIDNDGNFATDCDDDACGADPICTESSQIIEVPLPTGGLTIPDNNSEGAVAPFDVEAPGNISAMTLTVDIAHTFRGDISISLVHPDGTRSELQASSSDGEENLQRSYVVEDFAGKAAAGSYQLIVADNAAVDEGTLNAASVELVLE